MRTLYILQESSLREADPNFILAGQLVSNGLVSEVRVVDSMIFSRLLSLPLFKPSYVLLKSAPFYLKSRLQKMQKNGHILLCMNAEALVTFDTEDTYDGFMTDYRTVEHLDGILVGTAKEARSVSKYLKRHDKASKIFEVGYVRAPSKEFALKYFESEIEALRERHGSFVIWATSFGLGVGKTILGLDPTETEIRNYFLGEGADENNAELMTQWALYNRRTVPSVMKGIVESFGKILNGKLKLVVRPHPSDDIETIRGMVDSYEFVDVEYGGNIIPYLLATDCAIAQTSTVLVEANFLETPTLCPLPKEDSSIYEYLASVPANAMSSQVEDKGGFDTYFQHLKDGNLKCSEEGIQAAKHLMGADLDIQKAWTAVFSESRQPADRTWLKHILEVVFLSFLSGAFIAIYLGWIRLKFGQKRSRYFRQKNIQHVAKDLMRFRSKKSLFGNARIISLGAAGYAVHKS